MPTAKVSDWPQELPYLRPKDVPDRVQRVLYRQQKMGLYENIKVLSLYVSA